MALRTIRPSVSSPPRFRPQLECLEGRDCPSGTDPLGTYPPPPLPPPPPPISINMPPTVQLIVTPLQGRQVTLHGFVQDESPDTSTLYFSGIYSGSVTPAEDGSFCLVTELPSLGTITATAVDDLGQSSLPASFTPFNMSPSIYQFAAMHVAGNTWTFCGTVFDESSSGLWVEFGGLESLETQRAQVGADGRFSLTIELASGERGIATAQTTDWWNVASTIAEALVYPPV